MKTTPLLILIPLAGCALLGGCAVMEGGPGGTARAARGDGFRRTLKSYHVIQGQRLGKVGFMKVYDVQEAGGPVYTWKYVYDLSINELGWFDQTGRAFHAKPYTDFQRDTQPESVRVIDLPDDTVSRNVLRMLGITAASDEVSFPVASDADIAK